MARNRKRKRKLSTGALIIRSAAYIIVGVAAVFAVIAAVKHLTKSSDEDIALDQSDTSAYTREASSSDPSDSTDTNASESSSADESETQSTESTEEENVDIDDIDNEWAMFLVNKNNPLPDNYDNMITTSVIYSTAEKDYEFDSRAASYMTDMIAAAKADGINLQVISSYRTIEYQQYNFDRSVQQRVNNGMTYDEAYEDTAKEVAFPGESEHNAGLSADIFSDEYVSLDDDGFKNTKAYAWLMENAASYGFILRYPEGKDDITGFIYEPWHFRFVGIYYAKKVQESGLCLEEYFDSMGWLDENGTAIKMTVTGVTDETSDTVTETPAEDESEGVVIIV
jgi:D-alanyl-D-alanine carboxypeptidase